MLKDNIIMLRKMHHLTQETLAEKVGVSRQTLSKWETGEAVPDIEKSVVLADVLEVSLDELVSYERQNSEFPIAPKGKHIFGVVKVGEKGQIVLPAKARKIFDIQPGDSLLVLGDEGQGIAIVKEKGFLSMLHSLKEMNEKNI